MSVEDKHSLKYDSTQETCGSIIREFALNTSTHGLPGIARSRSKHNCIFWTVSFLSFFGVTFCFVAHSIKAYFDYPTQTSISIAVERSQIFPAVTVCNVLPLRTDRFLAPFLNFTNSINLTHSNDTSMITFEEAVFIRDFIQHQINAFQSINDYFFSLDIMLINCSYNKVPCTKNDFISFISPIHGLCYTFNAKTKINNGTDLRRTDDCGDTGKFLIRLYTHNHIAMSYLPEEIAGGVVAMVHDNAQLPIIDVGGIALLPGRKHTLGYRKRNNFFLAAPYTECTTNIPLAMQVMYSQYGDADYVYSQTICIKLCTQAFIYQQCGCVNPYEWSARLVVLPNTNEIINASLCEFSNSCFSNATEIFSRSNSLWNEFCSDCRPDCTSVSFLVTPSSLPAPSAPFAYMTKNFIESLNIPLPMDWYKNWHNEVQNNYVSLEVVCESNRVENYTQIASLSPVDVLSNVGGLSGLWIGISFLSVMEFIEMLYRIIRYKYYIVRRVFITVTA